jgi:hypothetical protein
MKITRDSYESWFLDYLEGNLKEEMTDDFLQFIRQNPDLKEELQSFEPVRLEKSNLAFPGKEKLYRENLDHSDTFDETAVAWMEGDLNPDSVAAFQEYLHHHPSRMRDMQLFSHTTLHPDPSVHFPDKQKLRHQSVILLFSSRIMRIAAVLLTGLILYSLLEKNQDNFEFGEKISVVSSYSNHVIQKNNQISKNISPKFPAVVSVRPDTKNEQSTDIKHTENTSIATDLQEKNPDLSSSDRIAEQALVSSLASSEDYLLPQSEPGIVVALPEVVELYAEDIPSEVYLTDRIKGKLGLTRGGLNKIARWGLNMAANITGNKFSYKTNQDDQVIAYNLDTRLLGVSIPVRNK